MQESKRSTVTRTAENGGVEIWHHSAWMGAVQEEAEVNTSSVVTSLLCAEQVSVRLETDIL